MKNYGRLNSFKEGYEIKTEIILRVRGCKEKIVGNLKVAISEAKNERRGATVFTRNVETWIEDGVEIKSPAETEKVFDNGR